MSTTLGAAPSTCGSVSIIGLASFSDIFGTVVAQDFNRGPEGGTAIAVALAPDVAATGTASAQAGLLRLTAESSYTNADRSGFIHTRSRATFSDLGTVSAVGLAAGTLVHATATVTIDGTATRNAGLLAAPALLIASDLNANLIAGLPPATIYHLNLHVGEVVTVFLGLSVFADASFSQSVSAADFGHSARFFLDFEEEGVVFAAESQHDYRTGALPPTGEVPIPGALPLFASALGGLGLTAYRRKRHTRAARCSAVR